MKVAIALDHHNDISAHFGRSPAFLILSLAGGQVLRKEIRINDQARHHDGSANTACHDHAHTHDHSRFVQLLGDCRAVICLGMGMGARTSLERTGIAVMVLKERCTPEEAAIQFEAGTLTPDPGACCRALGYDTPPHSWGGPQSPYWITSTPPHR